VDGCNTEAVGEVYAEDGVHAVGDVGEFTGRASIAAIVRDPGHVALVRAGCAHVSTLPYLVLDGDRASATCHTMVIMHTEKGFFVGRLSASRLELSRKSDSGWQINHRQNYLLDGAAAGPGLLARLREGPGAPQGATAL
jgi:hypothetical protein